MPLAEGVGTLADVEVGDCERDSRCDEFSASAAGGALLAVALPAITGCGIDVPLRGRATCTVRSDAGEAVASALEDDPALDAGASVEAVAVSIAFTCSLLSVVCLDEAGEPAFGGELVTGAAREDEAIETLSGCVAFVDSDFGEGRFCMTFINA